MWLEIRIFVLCSVIIANRANPVHENSQTVVESISSSDIRNTKNHPNESNFVISTPLADNIENTQEYVTQNIEPAAKITQSDIQSTINGVNPSLTNLSNVENVYQSYDPTLGNLDPKFLSQYVQSVVSSDNIPSSFAPGETTQPFGFGNVQQDQLSQMPYQNNLYPEIDRIPVFDIEDVETDQRPQRVPLNDSLTNDELARFNQFAKDIENVPLLMDGISPELENTLSMGRIMNPNSRQPLYVENILPEQNLPEQITTYTPGSRIPPLMKPQNNFGSLGPLGALPTNRLSNLNPGFSSFLNRNNGRVDQITEPTVSNTQSGLNPGQSPPARFPSSFNSNDQLAQAQTSNAKNSYLDQTAESDLNSNPLRKDSQFQQSASTIPNNLPINRNEPPNFFNFDSTLMNQFGLNQFRPPNPSTSPNFSDFPPPRYKRPKKFPCKRNFRKFVNQLNPAILMQLLGVGAMNNSNTSTPSIANSSPRTRRSPDSDSDIDSSESIESIESEADSLVGKLKSWVADVREKISTGLRGFQFSEEDDNEFNNLAADIYGNIDTLNPDSDYLPLFNSARSDMNEDGESFLKDLWKMLTDEAYRMYELRKQSLKELNEARKELKAALQDMSNGETYTDDFGRVKKHIDEAMGLLTESSPIYRALTYCTQNFPQKLSIVADMSQKILDYGSTVLT